jgi:hypothetical protein
VESVTDKSQTIARHRRRSSLTWIDFLVIAAIILTFATVVSTTLGRAKASTHNSASGYQFSTDVSQIPDDPGLIKAKIRLAVGGPWT